MLDLLGAFACIVAIAGIVLIVAAFSDSDLRARNIVLATIVGLILIAGGATTATLIFNRHDDVDAATAKRIADTYDVTINSAGDFRTTDVSVWRIDGIKASCFFTSTDMNTADLRCQAWDAEPDTEYVTPDNFPVK